MGLFKGMLRGLLGLCRRLTSLRMVLRVGSLTKALTSLLSFRSLLMYSLVERTARRGKVVGRGIERNRWGWGHWRGEDARGIGGGGQR